MRTRHEAWGRWVRARWAAGLAIAGLACSDGSAEDVGVVVSRIGGLARTGFVPYPVKSWPTDGSPPQSSWDGSLAELLAADALAQCAVDAELPYAGVEGDAYFAQLMTKMESAICPAAASAQAPLVLQWDNQRTVHEECNMDPVTGTQATLEPLTRDRANYEVPTASELGLTVASSVSGNALNEHAQAEVDMAEVNLCMAQRLREHLATADGLFASAAEQLELLNVIRERAQVSMLQYASLSAVFASTEATTAQITHQLQFLPLLRRWAAEMDAPQQWAIADDFATAIRLHVQTTTELAELLARAPFDETDENTAEKTWGVNSGRGRLLELLYGGSPTATSSVEGPHVVVDDVRDEQVETLLGLARKADALWLRVQETQYEMDLDEAATEERIYKTVEAELRRQNCEGETPGSPECQISWDDPSVPALEDFEQTEIWKRLGIAPTHARQLARLLHQQQFAWGHFTRGLYGRWHIVGQHERVAVGGSTTDFWVRFDPEFKLIQLQPLVLGRRLVQQNSVYVSTPETLELYANPREQGFISRYDNVSRDLVWTGSVPALAAIRYTIVRGTGQPPEAGMDALFSQLAPALPLIESAIGDTTSYLEPRFIMYGVSGESNCAIWSDPDPPPSCMRLLTAIPTHRLHVLAPASEEERRFAFGLSVPDMASAVYSASFVSAYGGTRQELLEDLDHVSAAVSTVPGLPDLRLWESDLSPWAQYNEGQSMFLARPDAAAPEQYFPLFLDLGPSQSGAHMGYGGQLTQAVRRAWATHELSWGRPRYDGFGWPIDWIPPSDPTLIGASQGEDAVAYYLRTARTAAQEATSAVLVAIERLTAQAFDQAALDVARTKARSVDAIEEKAFCGDDNDGCTTEQLGVMDIPLPECSPDAAWCQEAMSLAAPLASGIVAHPWLLENWTWQVQGAPSPGRYQGGSLYSTLVRHWNAFSALVGSIDALHALAQGLDGGVSAARATLAATEGEFQWRCVDPTGAQLAQAAGWSYSGEDLEYLSLMTYDCPGGDEPCIWNGGFKHSWRGVDSRSYSNAPEMQRQEMCLQLQGTLPVVAAEAEGVELNASAQLMAMLGQVLQARNDYGSTVAELVQASSQLELVQARNALEATVSEASTQTRFGITRRFHSFDLWRARALLENARRLSVAARRAIEARYVVDLSRMHEPEPFVDAPANWADEVYLPDLSVPSAVGIVVSPSGNPEQVYANKVEDYVRNLELFVQGYSVWRPTASALADTEVLTVAGPEVTVSVDCEDTLPPACDESASCLHVAHYAGSIAPNDNHLRPQLRIVNNGPQAVGLGELTLRYWFTPDSGATLESFCDWSSVGCSAVTQAIGIAEPAGSGASHYLEVGFNSSAVVEPGGNVEAQIRVVKSDWSNFNESDDYSYAPNTSFTANSHIALYREGALVWGTEPVEGPGPCAPNETFPMLAGSAAQWTFYCPEQDTWVGHPGLGQIPLADHLDTACDGSQPTKAKAAFVLDPWGRVAGNMANPPFGSRHNARWRRLAVNLVGTGIRDCQLSEDPSGCYAESFLRYDLRHTGRVWTTSHDGQWWPLNLPGARVEGGKAIAFEEWLDPLSHSWNLPIVSAAARTELIGRPLGGEYDLTIDLTPDVRLERLERVQILLESDYWVRQDR